MDIDFDAYAEDDEDEDEDDDMDDEDDEDQDDDEEAEDEDDEEEGDEDEYDGEERDLFTCRSSGAEVLRCSRQIYAEAKPIFLSWATMSVENDIGERYFWSYTLEQALRHMRRISFAGRKAGTKSYDICRSPDRITLVSQSSISIDLTAKRLHQLYHSDRKSIMGLMSTLRSPWFLHEIWGKTLMTTLEGLEETKEIYVRQHFRTESHPSNKDIVAGIYLVSYVGHSPCSNADRNRSPTNVMIRNLVNSVQIASKSVTKTDV